MKHDHGLNQCDFSKQRVPLAYPFEQRAPLIRTYVIPNVIMTICWELHSQSMSNEGAAFVAIIVIPIIGVIAFVLFILWAISYEMKRSKKMKEEGKEDEMSTKQFFTILIIAFALIALPKTIETILSFFD
jgi:hypothetical protein